VDGWRDDLRAAAPAVLGSWIVARLLTALGWIVARGDLVGGGRRPAGLGDALVSFDATFYRAIAQWGYPRCSPDDFACVEVRRFFPLYPAAGRALDVVTPLGAGTSLLVVANLAALVAGFAVWRLMSGLGRGPDVASRAVWLLVLFPASSILPFAYAEALGIGLTAVALGAVGRRRLVPAGAAGVLSGLLRPTGILLAVVPVVAAVQEWRGRAASATDAERPRPAWLGWALVAGAPAAGVAAFHLFLGVAVDDAGAPLRVQGKLRAGFREPFGRLLGAVWRTLTEDFRDAYNLAFALGFLALVLLAGTRLRRVVPVPWTVMAGVGLVVALSANNIDSLGRYGLAVYPAWLAALTILTTWRRWAYPVVLVASGLGYVWMTVVTMRGVLIP